MAAPHTPSFMQDFGGGVPLPHPSEAWTTPRARPARPAVSEASNAARTDRAPLQPGYTYVQTSLRGVQNAETLPSVVENLVEKQEYFRSRGQLREWYVTLQSSMRT
jgi:hypothetical protein